MEKHTNFKGFHIVIFLNILLLLVVTIVTNRALSVGFSVSLLLLLSVRNNCNSKKALIFGLIIILVFIVTLAFCTKTDSTYGRLLIYKVSFNMFHNNWMYGIGSGKFYLQYLNYQRKYFEAGNYSIKELLLADNTHCAFNDYWQFILETGVLGVCFLLATVVIASRVILRAVDNTNGNSFPLLLSLMIFMSISTAALFTHVFERYLIQITYISAFFTIMYFAYPPRKKTLIILVITYFSMLTFYTWNYKIKTYYEYQKVEKIHNLFQAGYLNESLKSYQQLFDRMKSNPTFLVQYAEVLSASNKNIEAEQMMILALKKDSNNMLYNVLAKIYCKNGKLKEAEEAFLISVNMVPNRFITRFDLFLFYLDTKQEARALATGKEIMKLPVKIPSLSINTIINRVNKETKELTTKKKIFLNI